MKKSLLLLAIVSLSITCFSQELYWITPKNGHNYINDISFITSSTGFAVCKDGVILTRSNGNWTKMTSPVTSDLLAVDAISQTQALACGDSGVIVRLSGSTWTQEVTPDNRQLKDISYIDGNNAYAVGDGILYYNGTSWSDAGIGSQLECVDFLHANEGWAAGYGQFPVLMHYSNGTWTQDYSLQEIEAMLFDDITIINPQLVRLTGHTIEGDGRMYEYNGSTWEQVIGRPNNGSSFSDPSSGFGISIPFPMGYTAPPKIYKYANGQWTLDHSGSPLSLERYTSIEALSNNEAYVSSADGFIYHRQNEEWNTSNGFTRDSILDIYCAAPHNIYFACGKDGIWHYQEGVWTHELQDPGYIFNRVEADFEGWAAAYKEDIIPGFQEVRMYRRTGPEMWEQWTSPFEMWWPVTSLNHQEMYTSGNQINMYISNPGYSSQYLLPYSDSITSLSGTFYDGYLTTKHNEGNIKGTIYQTAAGGELWQLVYQTETAQLNDIEYVYHDMVYAVGDSGLIVYYDGETWTEFPSITSEDLLSVSINIYNEGWAVGRNGTILYFNGSAWSNFQSLTNKDLFVSSTPQYFPYTFFVLGGDNGTLLSDHYNLPIYINTSTADLNDSLTIFPNPSSGEIRISVSTKHSSEKNYEIFDLSGKVMLSGEILSSTNNQDAKINIRSLRAGTYIIMVISDNLVQTGKMVVL